MEGNDGDSKTRGLKEDGNSGRASEDGAGVDQVGKGSGDEEGRKDWSVSGVDGDGDCDQTEGRFCNGSESDEEGEGVEDISAGIARSNDSRKGKGRKRKRCNSVAENVYWGLVTTSKSTRGRVRTPNVGMRDQ